MTPAEQQKIIRRLSAGEDLPSGKREYKLVYLGKEYEEDDLEITGSHARRLPAGNR